MTEELEFLRYFYAEVDSYLGPASDDIYRHIIEDYEQDGYQVPKEYKPWTEDGGD